MVSDDRREAYPGLIGRQLAQRLVECVGRGARILELDLGIGRVAGPLVAAGAHVVGLDLSASVLPRRDEIKQTVPAVQGAPHTLPFVTHSFDAALAVHLLEHVPDALPLIHEVRRVLHPGTPFILGHDWYDPTTIDARIRTRWSQIVAELAPDVPPGATGDEAMLLEQVAREGGQIEPEVVLMQWSEQVSAATEIDRIAGRKHDASWSLPVALLQRSVEQLNAWMFTAHIDPNATDIALREFRVTLVRWPATAL